MKKKKLLVLLLSFVMIFSVISDGLAYFSADTTPTVPVVNPSNKLTAADVVLWDMQFFSDSAKLEGDKLNVQLGNGSGPIDAEGKTNIKFQVNIEFFDKNGIESDKSSNITEGKYIDIELPKAITHPNYPSEPDKATKFDEIRLSENAPYNYYEFKDDESPSNIIAKGYLITESDKQILRIIFTDYVQNANRSNVFLKFNFKSILTQWEEHKNIKIPIKILDENKDFTLNLITAVFYSNGEILSKWNPFGSDIEIGGVKKHIFSYRLFINRSMQELGYIKVEDRLSRPGGASLDGIEYVPETFKLLHVNYHPDHRPIHYTYHTYLYNELLAGDGMDTPKMVMDADKKGFTLYLPKQPDDPSDSRRRTSGYELVYGTTNYDDNEDLKNTAAIFTKGSITSINDQYEPHKINDAQSDNSKNSVERIGKMKFKFTGSAGSNPNKGVIKIKKVDSADSNIKIEGAKFKITHTDNTSYEGVTGGDGILLFPKLKDGSYTVKEIQAAPGYVNSSETQTVTITSGSTKEVQFLNTKTVIPKGSITIRKYITGTTTPIQGVEFTVGKKGDMGAPTKDMTDSDGTIVIKNLDMGDYEIKEISAPKGYKLNTASKEVTLQNADGKRDIVENFYNEKVLGSVKIKKLDASTKKDLKGAIFQILGSDSKLVAQTSETDENGVAIVGNLELGEYIVKEIKAPKGYTLNEKTQEFVIKDASEIMVTFENEKTPIPHPPSDEPTPEVEKPTPPTPKDPPKKEEPKKEEPKPEPPKEEPQPPADGIGGTGEPTPPTPTDDPIEGLTGGGAGGGTNDTNVLPGMIPGLSGGGSTAGGPNSAVDPGYVGRLPKTGEGLNSSAYALFFGLVGMSFVIYGAYKRRAKKQ